MWFGGAEEREEERWVGGFGGEGGRRGEKESHFLGVGESGDSVVS